VSSNEELPEPGPAVEELVSPQVTTPISSLGARLAFSVSVLTLLGLIAVVGQAARTDYVATALRRLWFGDRPEISIGTASYGLNCRNFPVPAPHPNTVGLGNASTAMRTACNGRQRCEYAVDISRIGDPANSCGKEFLVEYRCTGSQVVKTAFLPAEAHGKTLTLDCKVEGPN